MHIAHNTDHICFDFNSASNICILNVCSSAECIIRCSCSKRACSNCCSKICFFKTARFADVPNSCLDAFGVFKSSFFWDAACRTVFAPIQRRFSIIIFHGFFFIWTDYGLTFILDGIAKQYIVYHGTVLIHYINQIL